MKNRSKTKTNRQLMVIKLNDFSINNFILTRVIMVTYIYSDFTTETEFEYHSDELYETMRLIMKHNPRNKKK